MIVLGNTLDKEQEIAAKTVNTNSIIIAGAGSGKSLTMVGKVKYLVQVKNIPINNILCITFTNAAAISLEEKIKKELNQDNKVYTFHKLALNILKNSNINKNIADTDLLEYLVREIFASLPYQEYFAKLFLNKKYYTTKYFVNYQNTIIKFIRLFISNFNTISSFDNIINKAHKKDIPFLKIIKKIYEIYILEKTSSNVIDFDDMITLATKVIKEHGLKENYQYIIIDEYQDTSKIRENLIKEIINKTKAYITVVGDDFQSIYRFSGCNITNFLKFTSNFKPAKKLYLTNTYRNSSELIKIAGDFIMKNPQQIYKRLKSNKRISKPIIIYFYKNIKDDFYLVLNSIENNNLMILGRNNLDIYSYLDDRIQINNNILDFNNKNIYYKTIHKSKGLEEDNILIINLTNDINSLPSKIKEEKILKYLNNNYIYPYDEERRLFYVALTRTKNYVYLFVPKNNPSIFIKELIKNYKLYLNIIYL